MKEIKWLQDFDNDHTDSIWYGGDIVSIRLERYNVIIGAYGDVRAWIDDEHYCDKNNGGCFKEYLEEHGIYNDNDLRQAISENRIEFENNNWYEMVIWDKELNEYVERFDNVLDVDLDLNDDFAWVEELVETLDR